VSRGAILRGQMGGGKTLAKAQRHEREVGGGGKPAVAESLGDEERGKLVGGGGEVEFEEGGAGGSGGGALDGDGVVAGIERNEDRGVEATG